MSVTGKSFLLASCVLGLLVAAGAGCNRSRDRSASEPDERSGKPAASAPADAEAGFKPWAYTTRVVHQQAVSPGAADNVVRVPDRVAVTVPGGLLKGAATLTISEVDNPPPPNFEALVPLATWDVSLGDIHLLDKDIRIEMPVDPAGLRTDGPPAAVLSAGYYDVGEQSWIELPLEFDAARSVAVVRTRHLSVIRLCQVRPKWVVEMDEDVVVVYDPKDVAAKTSGYLAAFPPEHPTHAHMSESLKKNLGPFILDTLHYARSSLKNYRSFNKQLVPHSKPLRIYVEGTGSSSHDPVTGAINVTFAASSSAKLHYVIAHEMFHNVQLNWMGLVGSRWWMEATAEYAASRIAQPHYGLMGKRDEERLKPAFIHRSLTYASTPKPDWLQGAADLALGENPWRVHAYQGAYFIEFLVKNKGLKFDEMFLSIAAGGFSEAALDKLLKTSGGLAGCYRDFVHYWLFDQASPVRPATEILGKLQANAAAEGLPKTLEPDAAHVSTRLTMDRGLSAKLWILHVPAGQQSPGSQKLRVELLPAEPLPKPNPIELSESITAEIYRCPGSALASPMTPALVLGAGAPGDALAGEVDVQGGDRLAMLVFNNDVSRHGMPVVTVARAVLSIGRPIADVEKGVIGHEYAFSARWADKGKPAGEMTYKWDFGDGSGGTGERAVHKYRGAGSYAVGLEAVSKDGTHKARTTFVIAPDVAVDKEQVTFYVYRRFKNRMGTSKQACQDFRVSILNAQGQIVDGGSSAGRNGSFEIILPTGTWGYKVTGSFANPPGQVGSSGKFTVTKGGRNNVEVEGTPAE